MAALFAQLLIYFTNAMSLITGSPQSTPLHARTTPSHPLLSLLLPCGVGHVAQMVPALRLVLFMSLIPCHRGGGGGGIYVAPHESTTSSPPHT